MFSNPRINIFSGTFNTTPISIGDKAVEIYARISNGISDEVNLTWSLSSSNNPLFAVSGGSLSIVNLTLIQNTESKSTFLSISESKGKITINSCIILGSFSSISTSQFSFSSISSGRISFLSCIFENLSFSLQSCIIIEGSNSSLLLENSTFSSISSGSSKGGIISAGNSTRSIALNGISISLLTLTNSNISGGAIYTFNVSSIFIIGSRFTGISSMWDGGALYISLFGSFVLNTSTFSSCSSNRHGGAIACLPSENSSVLYYGDNFTGNSAPNGKGNDFCDVSTNPSSVSAYSYSPFSSILSSSSSNRFYHLSRDLSFDCFFTKTCQKHEIYIDSLTGCDYFFCGETSFPCFSLEYSFSVALYTATFYLNIGDYFLSNNYIFSTTEMNFIAQTIDKGGDVVIGNIETYPKIVINSSITSSVAFNVTSSIFTISYIKFFFSSTSAANLQILFGFYNLIYFNILNLY
jgi:hypothetical protein